MEIRVLGTLEIIHNGAVVTDFISKKVPALLVYLAVTGTSQSRDHLAGLLWGEMPDSDARGNLRQALANLRRLFESHLVITPDSIAFNTVRPYFLDAHAFQASLAASHDASGVQRIAHLRQAADLYRGDFLPGFFLRDAPDFEEWIIAQRERWRELAFSAFHTLVTHYIAQRDYLLGIEYATRLLTLDPLREETHRQMMLLLARSGQQSAALAQFETCRRLLADEMGVEPTAETVALHERIRVAASAPRHNLPPQSTPFIGRHQELDTICQRLADPTCRLLTLVGPGGAGKTRLAIQAALTCGETFLSGVRFVPLADAGAALSVFTGIAHALHITLRSGGDARSQIISYLRQKEMLLILDSFEHLVEAGPLLTDILQNAHDVKILITSTERLNLHGEWVVNIQGLCLPPDEKASDPDESCALQLFLQTAQRVQPGFTLHSTEEKAAAVQICRLVDALPLGIELAAAWVRVLPSTGIAAEIAANLDFLTTAQSDVPERQRSLRAVFDYTWNRLSAPERSVLQKLAVFRGGFQREAAQHVAGASLALLSALVDKSLVRQTGRPSGRYELHSTTRQYADAQAQQSPEEYRQTRDLYCRYYSAFIAQRRQALFCAEQKQAVADISAEIQNVQAAWEWAIQGSRLDDIAVAADSLARFYELRGWYEEGRHAFQKAAAAARRWAIAHQSEQDAHLLTARLLARQADFYARQGLLAEATELVQEASSLLQLVPGDVRSEEATCLDILGRMAWLSGHYQEALQHCQAGLRLRREVGSPWHIATSLHNLAVIASAMGEYLEVRRLQEESLALRRACGDTQGMAFSLESLGTVAQNLKEYEEAKRLRREGLALFKDIGDQFSVGRTLSNLGVVACLLEDYTEARQSFQTALDVARANGYRILEMNSLGNLGVAVCGLGNYEQAEVYLREALNMAMAMSASPFVLSYLADFAGVQAKKAQADGHAGHLQSQAVEIASFASQHPAASGETKRKAEQLLANLTRELPADLLAGAGERGRTQTLEEVIARVLA